MGCKGVYITRTCYHDNVARRKPKFLVKTLTCIIYRTPTATATIQSTLKPTVAAKITQDSVADSPWSATAETSAFIGQPLKLWVYILEAAFRSTYIVKV